MGPSAEAENYPMGIKDEDGPFLIMEAPVYGDDTLDEEFKKTAGYTVSCATVGTAIAMCHGMTDGTQDPWYESWNKAVERYSPADCPGAGSIYWIEPTDVWTALGAIKPQADLEQYVHEAIDRISCFTTGMFDADTFYEWFGINDVKELLSSAWDIAGYLQEMGGNSDVDAVEDAAYKAYTTVSDIVDAKAAKR